MDFSSESQARMVSGKTPLPGRGGVFTGGLVTTAGASAAGGGGAPTGVASAMVS